MTVDQLRQQWIYDDFTDAELSPARWAILRAKGPDGTLYPYQDRNATVRTGDGAVELTIVPFTRFHDSNPLQNNAKQMYCSVERIPVPATGSLTVEVDMTVRTYGQVPYDLMDAFATVNLFDLTTGVVLDAAATNDCVYAILERLLIPGVTSENERYIHRTVLDMATEPGQSHRYAIRYEAETSLATWYVDGRRLYWSTVGVPVEAFQLGMALFSARDLSRYSRAEREHGQGASSCWGAWTITVEG
jgi:hypothetical protein